MTKSKGLIKFLLLPLIFLAIIFGNGLIAVSADDAASAKNGAVTVTDNYVSSVGYQNGESGLMLSFSATGEENAFVFDEYLDLSTDAKVNLLSLALEPDKIGVNNVESITVKLKDVISSSDGEKDYSGKAVEIKISSYGSERDNSGIVDLFAKATDGTNTQDFGGQTKDGGIRSGNYGNVKSFSFAGKNKNVLDLSYQNKCVLATPVYSTYPEVVRDLAKVYKDENGNDVDDCLFDGFGDKVEVSIFVNLMKVDNAKANVIIYRLGGNRITSPLSAKAPSLGVVDRPYLIPDLLVWKDGFSTATKDFEYKVFDSEETLISSGISTQNSNVSFIPVAAGDYVIEYSLNGETTKVNIKVLSEQEYQTKIFDFTEYKKDFVGFFFPNTVITASATCKNEIDLEGSTVRLYAKLFDGEGDELQSVEILDSQAELTLPATVGTYKLVYQAVNYVNDIVTTPEIKIEVKEEFVNFVGEIDEYDYADFGTDRTDGIFNPSKADLEIYDCALGKVLAQDYSLSVLIKAPNAMDFTVESDFLSTGEYVIKYQISYAEKNIEVERILNIFDSVKPKIEFDGEFTCIKVDDKKQSSENTVYYKALKGSTCVFPQITASDPSGVKKNLTEDIVYLEKTPSTQMQNKSQNISGDNYSISFEENGLYYLKFSVSDAFGLEQSITYIIEVKEFWYELEVPEDLKLEQRTSGVIIEGFSIKDFAGNQIDNADIRAELYLNENIIDTNAYGKVLTQLKPGEYLAKIYATHNGEITSNYIYSFSVIDDEQPRLTLKNKQTTGKTNKSVKIAEYQVSDNDIVESVIVKVFFGQEEVNFNNDAFTPDKVGKYTVVYTATDISGNVTVIEYQIDVAKNLTTLIVIISVASVVLLGGIATALIILKKKKQK